MPTVNLEKLSWKAVETYLRSDDRIILPVGSTEQHGVFAPLGTDTYVAQAIADEAGQKARVLVAPPLWFGWSPHHLVKPGTLSVRAEILIEMLCDIIGSLAGHGFKHFVVVNGHRIVNISWMQIAAERVQRTFSVKVALFDPAYMSKEITGKLGFGSIGHGEEIEISHMCHIHPELIRLEAATDNPHDETHLYHLDPQDPRDTLCYVPTTRKALRRTFEKTGDTVTGHPTRSSADKGKAYHAHLVGRLVEVLEMMKEKTA
jgi:creatinine amidohydrolase